MTTYQAKCRVCDTPLEVDEEYMVTTYGSSYERMPKAKWTWYCDPCDLAGSLEELGIAVEQTKIRGLTLQRPWEYAIFNLGKDVENRTWRPPVSMIGQYLAIHAGQTYDKAGARWIEQKFGLVIPETQGGVIVGVVKLADVVTESTSPWFVGPFGWVLAEKVAIEPVPCSGKLGLWALPDDVLEQVRAN